MKVNGIKGCKTVTANHTKTVNYYLLLLLFTLT